MHYPTLMCAGRSFVIAWGLVAFGCAGAVATSAGTDGGSTSTSPTPGAGTVDADVVETAPADSASCVISASNYDHSCTVDTDCVLVYPGNYCADGDVPAQDVCFCPSVAAAISASASSQFNADVSKTPLGSGAVHTASCNCPSGPSGGLCCRQGQCATSCQATTDTLPACTDAGGTCLYGYGGASCMTAGPASSCAYTDETCCVVP